MKKILTSKSFIKLAILTVLHAVYAGGAVYIWAAARNYEPMGPVVVVVCVLIPALMGNRLVDRPKWWLISLPVQLLVGLGVQFFSWKFLNPSRVLFGNPGIFKLTLYVLVFLLFQFIGAGMKIFTIAAKSQIDESTEAESQSDESTNKDVPKGTTFIRLAILTGVTALYVAYSPAIMIFTGFLPTAMAAAPVAVIAYMIVPLLSAMFAVDRIKWWAISLPFRFILYAGILYVSLSGSYPETSWHQYPGIPAPSNVNFLLESIVYALILLAAEIVGAWIKSLWLNRKARKRDQQ